MPVSKPVSPGAVNVSLSDALEVRCGPLYEEEVWSVLCQSAKALQDIFLRGEAVVQGTPRFVLCPYTLHFTPGGRVTFAETIDPTLPNIHNFLSPEVLSGHLNPSDAAVEKMLVYSLGITLFWAAEYTATPPSRASLTHDLHSILLAMTNKNTDSRVALIHILEACTLHARQANTGIPYSHHVMKLSKIVMGSVYELDALVDEVDGDLNSSNPFNGSGSPSQNGVPLEHNRSSDSFFALPYLSYHDVRPFYQNFTPPYRFQDFQPCSCSFPVPCPCRLSPAKRQNHYQNSNNNHSPSSKRPRSSKDGRHYHHEPDVSSHHSRSRSLKRDASAPGRHHLSNISTSTVDSRDSYDERDAAHHPHRTQSTTGVEDTGRSYHLSDIFTPTLSPSRDHSRERSRDRPREHYRDRMRDRSEERSRDRTRENSQERLIKKSHRSSPAGEGKRSQTNAVYDRLNERRDRLRLLREQLGIKHRDIDLRRPLLGYHSDSGTMSDDGSEVRSQRPELRARSLKSLTSMESAQEGSYYPDQHQYASSDSLSTDLGRVNGHRNHRPDPGGVERRTQGQPVQAVPKPSSLPRVESNQRQNSGTPGRVPVNGHAPQAPNGTRDPPKKKLKKFFGPEFVVMSSTANESVDMMPSILCKAGKIPPDRKKVTVVLLNGRRLDLMCDLGIKGQEMFDLVASQIGLSEKVYFGLAYIKDGEYFFLDSDIKLYKVGPDSWKEEVKKGSKKAVITDKFTLFFRIKFYLENTAMLKDQLTRHQYYLQLRRDILEEKTRCDEQAALQLASLALQAEMGDYHGETMGRNYFLPEHYVPSEIIDTVGVPKIRQTLPPMHATHNGMGEMQAEMEFLMEARKLQEYGIHFHRASRSKKDPSASIWLGICTRGIIVYEKRGRTRQQVHAHPWHLTRKIAFNRKRFTVEGNDGSSNKNIHYTEDYKKGRYMLHLCQSQHTFQMAMRLKANTSHKFGQDFPMETSESNTDSMRFSPYNDYPDDELDFSDDNEGSIQNSVPESLFQENNVYQNNGRFVSDYKEIGHRDRGASPEKRLGREREPPPEYNNQPAYPYHSRERDDEQTVMVDERRKPSGSKDYHSKETLTYDEVTPERSESRRSQGRRVSESRSSRLERQNQHLSFRSGSSNETSNHRTPSGSGVKGRTPDLRSQSSRDDFEDEHPYATVADMEREINQHAREEDELDGRRILGLDEVDTPFVIDESIRTHERTRQTPLDDRTEAISETLQERLDELPSPEKSERDISVVSLKKHPQHGLGINIVGGENSRNLDLGIFVQSVVPGGPADLDGRLQPGDRIISINGQSLEGVGHRVAVDILSNAPATVQLIVSQPRSSSPDSKPRPRVVEKELITSSQASQSHAQLPLSTSNTQPESPATQKRKSTPPKKPRRRPQSFGSNYSLALSDASHLSDGSGSKTPPQAIRARYLSAENARPPRAVGSNQNTQESLPERSATEPKGQGSVRGQRKSPSIHSDVHFSSDASSDVPTPESSDLDDLFPEENQKSTKPSLIIQGSLANSLSDAADSTADVNMDMTRTEEDVGKEEEPQRSDEGQREVKGHTKMKLGDVYRVHLKKTNNSLGISVTGGVNTSVKHGGIYIKSMVKDGAADADGRILVGDRVLEVNSESLEGVTHRQAVETLRRAPGQSVLVIERGVPPPKASNLPPTPAASPMVALGDDGKAVVMSNTRSQLHAKPPSSGNTELDVQTTDRPSSVASYTDNDRQTPLDTDPVTPSDTPIFSRESDTTPMLSSVIGTPIDEVVSPVVSQAPPPRLSTLEDNDDWPHSMSSRGSTVRKADLIPLEKAKPLGEEDSYDGDGLLPVPSDWPEDFRGATPTIQAFKDFELPDSAPLSEAESDDPQGSSTGSETPLPSDHSIMGVPFDPEITSPILSTREADTLTPTAHLDWRNTPTSSLEKGMWGAKAASFRSSSNAPIMEHSTDNQRSSMGQWTDDDEWSPTPSTEYRSRSPSLDGRSLQDHEFLSDGEDMMPSAIMHDSLAADGTIVSAKSPNLPDINTAIIVLSPADPKGVVSPSVNDSLSPFPSLDGSLPLPSDVPSSRSPTPDLPPLIIGNDGLTLPDDSMHSPMSEMSSVGALTLTQTMMSTMGLENNIELPDLPYVTPENCFEVQLTKGTQGLGFSIQGGKGTHKDPKMCLLRIKKVFGGQRAAASGLVEEGDVILTVNEEPVYHLTHAETVAVLRGAPQDVRLLLCRPSDEELDLITLQEDEKHFERVLCSPTQPTSPKATKEIQTLDLDSTLSLLSPTLLDTTDQFLPPPSTSEPHSSESQSLKLVLGSTPKGSQVNVRSPVTSPTSSLSSPMKSLGDTWSGEYFEVTLAKPVKGGLGFTVAGGANSGGCYIKDILQDPAKSDGRLKKGDKLVNVNGTSMLDMSHFDAVSFLRMTPQEVTIKILRYQQPLDTPSAMPIPTPDPPPVPSSPPPDSPTLPHEKFAGPTSESTPTFSRSDTTAIVNVRELPIIRVQRNPMGQLGLSLTFDLKGGKSGIVVSDVIPGLPAASEGSIQVNDLIHAINGKNLRGMSLMQARRLLEVAPNTVELKLTRNGEPVHPSRTLTSPSSTIDSPKMVSSRVEQVERSPYHLEDGELTVEEEMKGVMDSLDLDRGDLSSELAEETDWEDVSESDKEHLDDVDAIFASLEAEHGITLPDEIKENRGTPVDTTHPVKVIQAVAVAEAPTRQSMPWENNEIDVHETLASPSSLNSTPMPTPPLTPTPSLTPTPPLTLTPPDSPPPSLPDSEPPLPLSPPPREMESPIPEVAPSDASSWDVVDSPTPSEAPTVDRASRGIIERASTPVEFDRASEGKVDKSEGGVIWIELEKPANGSLGFSLTGAMKGGKTSIFIKTVTPGGVAEMDGRLQVGDRLLQVNGESLVGMTQNKAVGLLRKSKVVVKLAVTRQLARPTVVFATQQMREPKRPAPSLIHESPVPALNLPRHSDNEEESLVLSYTESARDAELDDAGHDTDDDMNSAMDLPDDSANRHKERSSTSGSRGTNAAVKFGQALKARGQMLPESDDSSSWGSDTGIPLSSDHGHTPTPRATPSHKILSVISDGELRRTALVRPVIGGRYSGRPLRNLIATLQMQMDKQDPAEEFKMLRNVKVTDNCEEAKRPINKDKNRYRNVLPYDKTRVVIQYAGNADYINASFINVQVGKDRYHYIACQGPLPQTNGDFWQMVWEQRSDVIAMVTQAVESGKVKCDRYWPDSMETPIMVAGRYQLRLDSMQTLDNFDIRKISMSDTKTNTIHFVTHLNFTAWTDHGVPLSSIPLLRYTKYMRKIHANGPIVVHCSAGIGRTGTLITVDAMMGLIDRDETFKIGDIVRGLRSQRQGMIQTKDQYLFCYKAAIELLKTLI